MKIAQFLDDDRRIQIHTETAAKLALKKREKEGKRGKKREKKARWPDEWARYVFVRIVNIMGGKGVSKREGQRSK